jgi:hypothetical protein
MPKRRVGVSLRKPSPAPEPAEGPTEIRSADGPADDALKPPLERTRIEAFVSGATMALENAASELPTARLEALLKRGAEGFRELTVYLPEKLARDLSLYCRDHDLDMNRLVEAAVRQHLHAADSPVEGRRVGVAARALLDELAHWARALWSNRQRVWPTPSEASVAS